MLTRICRSNRNCPDSKWGRGGYRGKWRACSKDEPVDKPKEIKQRIAGLRRGEVIYMSDDFDDELPDEFWGFDKEL